MNETGCDVLVIGGGVAGALAAAAAGRAGARTVLVEKEAWLGGTGYAALLQHLCGLYVNGDGLPRDTLNSGLVREVVAALNRLSPGTAILKIGKVFVLPYDREALRSVLETLCSGVKGVDVMRSSTLISLEKRGQDVGRAVIMHNGVPLVLVPGTIIDCSGSGEAAVLAGAQFELTPLRDRQLAGYILQVKGLAAADDALSLKVPFVLAQAANRGAVPAAAKFTAFLSGRSPDEGFLKMSIDGEESAEREERVKKDAAAIHETLMSALPAFRKSQIAGASLRVTEREGRRIAGEYVLTREDVLQARKFPDGVVKNAWPIELWDRSRGTVYEYVPAGDYYEIPFRCLLVKGVPNMLTAGRCISVSREALGSTRVMGTCMALGEQAGKAAAYRVKYGKWPESEDGGRGGKSRDVL